MTVVCLTYWAFPVPETIRIRWTSQWQRGKYNVPSSGSVELGIQGSFEDGHGREKGKRADMVIILLPSELLGEEKLVP